MLSLSAHKHIGRLVIRAGLLTALIGAGSGFQQLPGTSGQQGAAIGAVGGAVTGAAVAGEHHRLLGALVGGAVGAGGGYLIGANKDRITGRDTAGAENAVRRAQEHPATPQEALSASTADLNGDGFVTMDEVIAMRQAGFSDQQILDRMRITGQVFELTAEQQAYLRNNGVDEFVIGQIPQLNREVRNGLLGGQSAPAPTGSVPVYPPQTAPPGAPVYPPPRGTPGAAPVYPSAPPPSTTPVPPPPGP